MAQVVLPYYQRVIAYEQDKALWVAAHPEATHHEYQQALRQLAAKWGI